MFEDLLPQTCQITKQVEVTDEWDPNAFTNQIILDGVPCRFDSLLVTRYSGSVTDVNMPGKAGGIVFIPGNYGSGLSRQFNEQNTLVIDGQPFEILLVHDVWDADTVHHYEVEVNRGINR